MNRLRARIAVRYRRWIERNYRAAHRDHRTARLAMAATIGTPAARAMEDYARRAHRRLAVWDAIWTNLYGGER